MGQGFHTNRSHSKTVSNSVCLSEGATVTKGGGGLTDSSIELDVVVTH